jgi:hypothetical protein
VVRTARPFVVASLLLVAWLSVTDCVAQTSGGTLWSFLGIPTNAADQASSNPAIAAAAKAKAAKHEICKKKKAIEYLAGMGCSAEHPEVAAALLAAMGDPDEPVRYEAVKAVMQTAEACQSAEQKRDSKKALSHGERCHDLKKKVEKAICDCIDRLCGKAPPKEHNHKLKTLFGGEECPQEPAICGKGLGSCCTPEIREKLQQLAYGRDDRGCFLERSSRVRELAAAALQACSACGGCGCPDTGIGGVFREMPPEEAREMGPDSSGRLLDGDCVYESVVVPMTPPLQPSFPEPLLSQPPAPEPPPDRGVPSPELIPAPSASLEKAAMRQAMLPHAGARYPAPVLPPRPAPRTPPRSPSEIWNPTSPADAFAPATPPPSWPGTTPLADPDTVRRSLGTLEVAVAMARLPDQSPAAPLPRVEPRKPMPPRPTAVTTEAATTATPPTAAVVTIAMAITALLAAIAAVKEEAGRARQEVQERRPPRRGRPRSPGSVAAP